MEPSGRNQWQPVANVGARKRQKQAKTVATGCHQLPIGAHGKEGVDGSSPSEGFTKGQQMAVLLPQARTTRSSTAPQSVPKICPQHCRGLAVLA
jgi:hypothetical protein